jgi:ABC-type branched-subunit amino acid transport system ATPase component
LADFYQRFFRWDSLSKHPWVCDFLSDALHLRWVRREEKSLERSAREFIHYLELDHVANCRVADLPFGTQKRVELARALAARPKLLLLDEPAGGLNHREVGELGQLIRRIRDERNVTVLLVEHHMNLVMSISDRVVALDFGRKIAEGTPDEVRNDREVIRAYLGTLPRWGRFSSPRGIFAPFTERRAFCKANRIETGERSGGIGEICSVEVDEK